MTNAIADGDQIGDRRRGEDYFHDGAGPSSGAPQRSSQSATLLNGIVCPAAACARAWATARANASSSVGSKTVAGSTMNHLRPPSPKPPHPPRNPPAGVAPRAALWSRS